MSHDHASHINALLSKRLAQERMARGISKKKLAAMAGMDRSTVAFIEAPEQNPTIYNLLRYSLALGVDLGSLISEVQGECKSSKAGKPAKRAV